MWPRLRASGGAEGGRGTWTLLKPEALREWREKNKVSRARLATMLGVSSTSIQNWETGTVASMKMQKRLAEILAAPRESLPLPTKPASLWDARASESGAPAVMATGSIVAAYAKAHEKLSTDELVALTRAVRQALA